MYTCLFYASQLRSDPLTALPPHVSTHLRVYNKCVILFMNVTLAVYRYICLLIDFVSDIIITRASRVWIVLYLFFFHLTHIIGSILLSYRNHYTEQLNIVVYARIIHTLDFLPKPCDYTVKSFSKIDVLKCTKTKDKLM